MPASSTLVNTSDTAELRLVQLLAKSLGDSEKADEIFIRDCDTFIAQADASALLHRIIGVSQTEPTTLPLVSLLDPSITPTTSEATGAFALLAIILERVQDKKEQVQLLHSLVSTLESLVRSYMNSLLTLSSSEGEDQSSTVIQDVTKVLEVKQRVLAMLCTLYNVRASHKEKCFLLSRIFTVAAFTSTWKNVQARNLEQDMILNLLPGRNTTLGNLLEYHNLVRLVEMELSAKADTETEEEDEVPTAEDKRNLYSTASHVLKQVVEISMTSHHEGGGGKSDDEDAASSSTWIASAAILEKERAIARVNQQRFLLKLLATYNDAGISSLDSLALESAKEAAVGLISDPISLFHDQRGITSLVPIQALKLNPGM